MTAHLLTDRAGRYDAFEALDGRSFYFEHEASGADSGILIRVQDGVATSSEDRAGRDAGPVPAAILNWLRLAGVDVNTIR
jgi:hypothetical protein